MNIIRILFIQLILGVFISSFAPYALATQRADMQIILKPKQDARDTYIINQVTASGTGGGVAGSGTLVSNAKTLDEIFRASAQNAGVPYAFVKAIARIESGVLTYSDAEVQQFNTLNWWEGLRTDSCQGSTISPDNCNDPLIRRGYAYNTCHPMYKMGCFPGADVRGAMQFEIQSWDGIKTAIPNPDGHAVDRRYVKDNIVGAGILIRNKVKVYYPNVGSDNWTEEQVKAAAGAYCGDPTARACMHGGTRYDDLAWLYYQEFSAQEQK